MSLKRTLPSYYNEYQYMGAKHSTLSSQQQQHYPHQKKLKRTTATGQSPSHSVIHQPSYLSATTQPIITHTAPTNTTATATRTYKHYSTLEQKQGVVDREFDEESCLQWFQRYCDPDTPACISPEGTQRFLEDLDISVEEKMAIVVAWKLNIANMGYITHQEWMNGMKALGTDTQEQFLKYRTEFELTFQDPAQFRNIYRYTFDYGKNKDQKCMDVDIACALWTVLLGDSFAMVADFIRFLQEVQPVRVINRDQWQNFHEFITTVSDDLSDYDETAAWPVLFDEYVEWKRNLSL